MSLTDCHFFFVVQEVSNRHSRRFIREIWDNTSLTRTRHLWFSVRIIKRDTLRNETEFSSFFFTFFFMFKIFPLLTSLSLLWELSIDPRRVSPCPVSHVRPLSVLLSYLWSADSRRIRRRSGTLQVSPRRLHCACRCCTSRFLLPRADPSTCRVSTRGFSVMKNAKILIEFELFIFLKKEKRRKKMVHGKRKKNIVKIK